MDLSFINKEINYQTDNIIIIGDFNAHHSLWTSHQKDFTNAKGKYLFQFISDNKLHITNTKVPTYVTTNSFFLLDLTLVSSKLLLTTETFVLNNTYGSDHFPVITNILETVDIENDHIKNFNVKKANFPQFEQELNTSFISNTTSTNIAETYSIFTEAIYNAANKSIPQTKSNKKHKSVPYWTDKYKETVKKRNSSLSKHKLTNSLDDIIEYKKNKAITQKVIRQQQKTTWENFCSYLDKNSKLGPVWNMAKSLNGKNKSKHIPTLIQNDLTAISNIDKSNILAKHFASISSTSNYNKKFTKRKKSFENKYHIIPSFHSETQYLNDDFAKFELIDAINSSKRNKSPGEDGIYYDFLKHLLN